MEGGATVLVVDDDQALRMLCRVNLELEGHHVLEAASLGEARERIADEEVGVALFSGSVGFDFEPPSEVDAVVSKPFSPQLLTSTVERLAAQPSR
jgi:CheY-like chemotaxis protein